MAGIGDHLGELLWTKVLAPSFERLGRWEILLVCLLWFAGTAGWLYRDELTTGERVLWASLLALIALSWFGICRPLWKSDGSKSIPSLLFRGALLLFLAGTWASAAYLTYRIPMFAEGVAGLYVARFEGDRGDVVRDIIYNKISDYVGHQVGDPTDRERVQIVRLPRRFNPEDDGLKQFRTHRGSSSILTGRIDAGNTLTARLVNIRMQGVLTGPTSGFQLGQSQISLPDEIATLCEVVPFFLIGYRLYQTKDFERANKYFSRAIERLEGASKGDQGRTSARLMLASLYFFRGNGFYLQERNDKVKAVADWKNAVKLSGEGVVPSQSFLAPQNNQAFLLLREGELSSAKSAFENINKACDTRNGFEDSITCAYAAYNLADLQLDQHSYSQARDLLNTALQRFNATAKVTPILDLDFEFLAYIHNNLAYSYIQDAESLPQHATEYYGQAGREIVEVEKIFARRNENVPPAVQRNKARVYIQSKQWVEALRVLQQAHQSEPDNPEGSLLRAVAMRCTGDFLQSAEELKSFIAHQPNNVESTVGMEYFRRVVGQCSVPN